MFSLASLLYSLEALDNHTMACWLQGILGQALQQLRQLFERLPAVSAAAADADARFDHVCKHVRLQIEESSAKAAVIGMMSM